MTEAFRTLIVTAADAPLARALAGGLSEAGREMFETPLSQGGVAPATHYISSGWIDADMASLLDDPAVLHAACAAAGANVSLAQCQALVASSDVSIDPPFDAMARLGLTIVRGDT